MAVAKRCFVMAKKAGATDSITLTGGCAKNDGLKEAIEHVLKLKVINLKTDPQLMGALGAAEYARQKGLVFRGCPAVCRVFLESGSEAARLGLQTGQ